MYYKFVSIIAISLLASACVDNKTTSVSLNLDYASTSLGYRNSGLLSEGRLFIWDIVENTLVDLRTPIKLREASRTNPVNRQARKIGGFDIVGGVNISQALRAEVKSSVKSNVEFSVKDAVRVNNDRIYSALSDAYRQMAADGIDNYRAWRIGDIKSNQDRYKFVLTVDPILASEESIRLVNDKEFSGSIDIVREGVGNINVKIPKSATGKCSGINAVCYINAAVLDVFIQDNNNLGYGPAKNYSRENLSRAFRAGS